MAPIQARARPMALWRVSWATGRVAGVLTVWAPDGPTAVATVEAHPSRFGIPHQSPAVGRAVCLLASRLERAA